MEKSDMGHKDPRAWQYLNALLPLTPALHDEYQEVTCKSTVDKTTTVSQKDCAVITYKRLQSTDVLSWTWSSLTQWE